MNPTLYVFRPVPKDDVDVVFYDSSDFQGLVDYFNTNAGGYGSVFVQNPDGTATYNTWNGYFTLSHGDPVGLQYTYTANGDNPPTRWWYGNILHWWGHETLTPLQYFNRGFKLP